MVKTIGEICLVEDRNDEQNLATNSRSGKSTAHSCFILFPFQGEDDGRGGPAQNPVLLSDHFNFCAVLPAESMGSMVVIGSKLGYSLL